MISFWFIRVLHLFDICSIALLWCVSTAQLLASINMLFTFVVGSVRTWSKVKANIYYNFQPSITYHKWYHFNIIYIIRAMSQVHQLHIYDVVQWLSSLPLWTCCSHLYLVSVWRSSLKTGKRPRLDRTKTDQDRKFSGPIKTITAVRSSVHVHFRNLKTEQRLVLVVSTGLSSLTIL